MTDNSSKKYDIADAHKLKVFMQEIQTIMDKYPQSLIPNYLEDVPKELKESIEYIVEMVEKGV